MTKELKPNLLFFLVFLLVSALPQRALALNDRDVDETAALMQQMQAEREAEQQAFQQAQQQLNQMKSGDSPSMPGMFKIDEMMAPYRSLPPSQTKEHLHEKLKGKPFLDNPKMINFLDALIRDNKALSDLAKILEDRKKLAAFFVFNILIFLIGIMYKKLHQAKNRDAKFLTRVFRRLWRFTFMTGIRFGLIFYFFGANLSRTWTIAKQYLL